MTGRMGEIVQHGDRWIITDEGRALQTIDDLRMAIDHACKGDLLDASARLEWLRSWRQADKARHDNPNTPKDGERKWLHIRHRL